MTGHRLADLAQPRQHRLGPAEAVQAHHIGSALFEPLSGLDDPDPVGHLLEGHRGQGQHHRQAGGLGDLEGGQRLPGVVEGLADDEIGALLDSPADHLLEHPPHLGPARRIGGIPDIGVGDVAGHQVARDRVGDLTGDPQRRAVQRFEQLLLADHPHLLAVPVVGEGLDDVGSGPLEVHMQGAQRLRMLESDLGDELAGREVAAALELEQEALGADHGARVEAVGQDVVGHGQLSVHGEERSGIAERYGTGVWASSVMAMHESG